MLQIETSMTSYKPYLIRAIYEWIIDNQMTPYILVNAQHPQVKVPNDYVSEDGSIIFNVSPQAIVGLHLGNDRVVFTARFNGKPEQIFIPPVAIKAIYTKENGQGMAFEEEDDTQTEPPLPPSPPSQPPPSSIGGTGNKGLKKPKLKVVK